MNVASFFVVAVCSASNAVLAHTKPAHTKAPTTPQGVVPAKAKIRFIAYPSPAAPGAARHAQQPDFVGTGIGLARLEHEAAEIGARLAMGPGPEGWVVEVALPLE